MYRSAARGVRTASFLFCLVAVTGCDIAVGSHGGFDFGVPAGQATDQWTRSYPLTPGGRIEIINVNGKIEAEPTDGSSVEVFAVRSAKAPSEEAAKELLGKIEMREEVGDNRVRIEVRSPRTNGPSGQEIKWTVKVPRGVAVDLRTVNGGVRLTRLEGEVRARSTNGGITGIGLVATSVDAAVTNGGVDIELANAVTSGSFDLEAVNGGVSIRLPADSKADITGRAVNGGVSTSDLALETVGEQSRRRLYAKLNGGGAKISLETVNGGVRIQRAGVQTS
jgi:DUF4097 and DUF4098 domain-containing protein YvlB